MESNPLSPHLQIYRPQLTSVLSITHRLTGIFLGTVGIVIFLYWIGAAALGPEAYKKAIACLSTPIIKPLMGLWTFAFYYHLCNGIRHLLWDIGWGFSLGTAYKTGYAVVTSAIIFSSITWLYILELIP